MPARASTSTTSTRAASARRAVTHARVRRVEARREEHARVDARMIAPDPLVAREHRLEQAPHLVRAAPGEDRDAPRARRHAERLARGDAVAAHLLERRMADVVGVDADAAPDRLLERKHDGHAIEVTPERHRAAAPPRPHLRGAVPEHARAARPERLGEARVELGVVYK